MYINFEISFQYLIQSVNDTSNNINFIVSNKSYAGKFNGYESRVYDFKYDSDRIKDNGKICISFNGSHQYVAWIEFRGNKFMIAEEAILAKDPSNYKVYVDYRTLNLNTNFNTSLKARVFNPDTGKFRFYLNGTYTDE